MFFLTEKEPAEESTDSDLDLEAAPDESVEEEPEPETPDESGDSSE